MNFLNLIVPRFDDVIQRLAWKTAAILCTGMGLGGSDIVTGTATGDWWCVQALGGDVVFTSVTFRPGTSSGSMAGRTLSNGDRLYGNITAFTVASGVVVAYRASAGSPS